MISWSHSSGKFFQGSFSLYHLFYFLDGQANGILLPLESLLCKDVATMTEAMTKEREATKEISPVHGQAIFQSYHVKVEKTYEVFKPLVQSLTISVEGLYSMLTRLAQSASLHAGNLHKVVKRINMHFADALSKILISCYLI